jgi:hypothetical protein
VSSDYCMAPRMPRLQVPELRALAKDAPCHLLIPAIHRYEPGNVVWCHSNLLEHGHGLGIKSHDCFGCFGCYWCHHAIDHGLALTHEEKVHYMRKGMDRSLLYLWERQLIGVNK